MGPYALDASDMARLNMKQHANRGTEGCVRRWFFWRHYRRMIRAVRFSNDPQSVINELKVKRVGGLQCP